MNKRNSYSNEFKARVALESIKGEKTINELASEYKINANMIAKWKKHLLGNLAGVFARAGVDKTEDTEKEELYKQIGKMKVELDWLKKKLDMGVKEKRAMIEPGHPEISVSRQCELIGMNRSVWYYRPVDESEEDLLAKRLIDEQYTSTPFYGSRRMTVCLQKQGLDINRKRVTRLMREMGIQAIYPKPKLSISDSGHKIYPYLLGGLHIDRPDQVWSSDITYIRMSKGFVYLTAVMDWYSRYVLSWSLSNTMDVHFCLEALQKALMKSTPEIFNTDQGSQYTSMAFTGELIGHGIRVSMDSRGRAFDNIFIERLWRSLKYEEIYLNEYERVKHVVQGISRYFDFYNTRRPHQSLGYKTPHEVHYGRLPSAVNF